MLVTAPSAVAIGRKFMTLLLSDVLPYPTSPYHTIPFHTIPCHSIPYHTMPCQGIQHYVMPCNTMPCLTMPCHFTPHQVSVGDAAQPLDRPSTGIGETGEMRQDSRSSLWKNHLKSKFAEKKICNRADGRVAHCCISRSFGFLVGQSTNGRVTWSCFFITIFFATSYVSRFSICNTNTTMYFIQNRFCKFCKYNYCFVFIPREELEKLYKALSDELAAKSPINIQIIVKTFVIWT